MSEQTSTESIGSRRWIVPVVLSVSLYIAFIDRMNLSLAMPQIADFYGWSDEEIGAKGSLLLGSFYLAYGLSNLILSAFAARIGARRSMIALVAPSRSSRFLRTPQLFAGAIYRHQSLPGTG